MIAIARVSKRYGRKSVLSDVSLTVRPGEVTLLLGVNGAGKSTLLRCILGLVSFEGEITVAGCDPVTDGPGVRSHIGYMPQTSGLHPDLTVLETMTLFARIRRAPASRITPLLDEAGLGCEGGTVVAELSGGMRQRLGFALALLTDPPVLLLDEPSTSLDAASRRWLAGRLRDLAASGRTVLVSTHASQTLFDAGDRHVTIEDGRVIETDGDGPASAALLLAPRVASRASVRPIVQKELRDGLRNRWLVGYTALLAVLGLAATASGLDTVTGLSLQSFGRTTATMTNLCLMLAPLVAILMGAAAIAGERERGTLEHLLAQPLSRPQLLLGKHAGLLLALLAATFTGFLPAGVLVAISGGPDMLGHYLLFPALAMLAAAAMAGIGLIVSVTSQSAVQAQGTAVVVWFAFGLLYDLLLVGWLAASGLPAGWLAASLVVNPIDAVRVLAVLALEPDLYMLGPAGALLTTTLSPTGAASVLFAAAVLWAAGPVAVAVRLFSFPIRRKHSYVPSTTLAHHAGRQRRGTGRGDRLHVGGGARP